MPILESAREFLFITKPLAPAERQEHMKVGLAYISALAQTGADEAIRRQEQFFSSLPRLGNAFTTQNWYSRFHLDVVHEVIRGIAGRDLTLSPQARQWLEEDEGNVRRRIQADVQARLGGAT
jgi:cellulose synthase operon protein C